MTQKQKLIQGQGEQDKNKFKLHLIQVSSGHAILGWLKSPSASNNSDRHTLYSAAQTNLMDFSLDELKKNYSWA